MIKTFADKSTKEFWDTGKSGGMPPANLRNAAKKKLAMLHSARKLEDLRRDRAGQHSIRINDQWRICFVWRDGGAERVEVVDYHRG